MKIRPVGSRDGVFHVAHGLVRDDPHVAPSKPDGPAESQGSAGNVLYRPGVRQFRHVASEKIPELREAEFLVAPNERDHGPLLRVHYESLYQVALFDVKKPRHFPDGLRPGRVDFRNLLQTLARPAPFPFLGRNADSGQFQVGGVVRHRGAHYDVLSRVGGNHELVGEASAYVAGIGGHHAELEPASLEHADIGVVHGLVGRVRRLVGNVEAVGVLHYELARPHDPEPRTYLVPELRLYLVEIDRKLLVGADFSPDDVRYYLLVGRSQAEIALSPVLEAQKLLSVIIPSLGLHPGLGGKHRGHQKLYGSRPVHLVAHYVLDLSHAPEAEGQVVVYPGRELSYHARPHHEPVAHHLGVRRVFLDRGYEEGRKSHQAPLLDKLPRPRGGGRLS